MVSSADILHGKVLIVDDQEANVLLLEQMLRGAGYDRVTSTRDPTQVCELHLLNRYDLILLDLHMPGMDGFQVMENLKEIEVGGYLPVLVITAQPEHKLRALKAGARDFVSKPFELAEVLLRVHNQIEVRQLHQEAKHLYEQVTSEQKVSARLLLTNLPTSVAERLKAGSTEAREALNEFVTGSYAEVTVLFSDLLDFTAFAHGAAAAVITGALEAISKPLLDPGAQLDQRDIVTDAWLAAAGLPDAAATHSVAAVKKAVDFKAALDRFNRKSRYKLQVRIGFDVEAARNSLSLLEGKNSPNV